MRRARTPTLGPPHRHNLDRSGRRRHAMPGEAHLGAGGSSGCAPLRPPAAARREGGRPIQPAALGRPVSGRGHLRCRPRMRLCNAFPMDQVGCAVSAVVIGEHLGVTSDGDHRELTVLKTRSIRSTSSAFLGRLNLVSISARMRAASRSAASMICRSSGLSVMPIKCSPNTISSRCAVPASSSSICRSKGLKVCLLSG
jgi:hypothetical protein